MWVVSVTSPTAYVPTSVHPICIALRPSGSDRPSVARLSFVGSRLTHADWDPGHWYPRLSSLPLLGLGGTLWSHVAPFADVGSRARFARPLPRVDSPCGSTTSGAPDGDAHHSPDCVGFVRSLIEMQIGGFPLDPLPQSARFRYALRSRSGQCSCPPRGSHSIAVGPSSRHHSAGFGLETVAAQDACAAGPVVPAHSITMSSGSQ